MSSTQELPVSNLPPITPGTVLAGKYRVEKIIGQGGMGIVVEARHIALDERVALKFLLPDYAMHPEAAARFLREARAAVKIKSEHVARVSDVGTLDSGAPYMVMEFLEGDDLSKILEHRGTLAIPEAIDYMVQACEAIAEAHSHSIVHRDLKPANLFLTRRQDGFPLVKVLDFGISKTMGNAVENLTKTMAAMGSALYMSPEQMQQTRSVDHRTDIYALGISLYELLAGKQPFYAETLPQLCAEILTGTPTPLKQVRADVSDDLAARIERAYARDRAQRYQSVAEFVVALAPYAPQASRGTIERVARMGGIQLAGSGVDPRQSQPQIGHQSSPQLPPGAVPVGPQGAQPVQPGSGPIVLSAYNAPASARASAAFAHHGGSTNANLSTTGPGVAKSGKGALIASLAFGAVAIAVIAGVVLMKKGGDAKDGAAAQPTDTHAAEPAPAEPPKQTAAPKETTAPSAAAQPPSAAPSEPAPSASATAATAPAPAIPPHPGRKGPLPQPSAKATAKPAEAPPKPAAPPPKAFDPLAPPSDRHGD